MRRPSNPEWLARSLERCYQMRDAIDAIRVESEAAGPVSVADRIASSSVRDTIETWIAYYHRELRLLARRGGHGQAAVAAQVATSLVTEAREGAGGGVSCALTQVHT